MVDFPCISFLRVKAFFNPPPPLLVVNVNNKTNENLCYAPLHAVDIGFLVHEILLNVGKRENVRD